MHYFECDPNMRCNYLSHAQCTLTNLKCRIYTLKFLSNGLFDFTYTCVYTMHAQHCSTRKAVVEVVMIAFMFTHEQEAIPPGEDRSQAAVVGAVTSDVRNTTRNHL